MKKVLKEKSGITLIALVITIIVILILAGVSIATLTGENGILVQANKAKEETEIATEKEKIKLAFGAVIQRKIANNDSTNIGSKELEEELKKLEPNVEVTSEEENLKIKYLESKREYKITQKGEFLEETEKPSEDIKIKVKEETVKIMKKVEGNIEAKTMITGTEAYIRFEVEAEEGTKIKIEPEIPYQITKNGSYEFTITGTKENGKSKTIKYVVNVNNYVESPEAWIDFNGTSYIECNSIDQNKLVKGFTVATKVKINQAEQTGINWMGLWGRHINSTEGIQLQFHNNTTTLGGENYVPYYDKWIDIVRTFEVKEGNTGTLKLYFNGELKQTSQNTTILPCDKFYIGNSIDLESYDRRMKGEMSCLKIWTKALSEEEINSLDLFKDDVDVQPEYLYQNIMLKSQAEVDKIGTFVGTGHEFKQRK
ncbi:MAG: LamG domain-containing protein [Clostridia bacterium]